MCVLMFGFWLLWSLKMLPTLVLKQAPQPAGRASARTGQGL